ncbi:TIGR01777 family oxidoreductase [Psychrobacter sp.]|uniref:TIGR01777 family oxidoreductase n=1 Tax=Psychrobacter sp. TaxID=56811 RepID=UPI0026008823|nr:TIGR01777 family oxidoreductase [Psychrobacter sp.]
MNILISGGSGFLGSALSQLLNQERGTEVSITWLSRDKSQSHPSYITMMSYEELSQTSVSYDVIVNLAGAGIADKRWTKTRKKELFDSRILPTQSLLEYIGRIKHKPQLLISGSAIGWYGAQGNKPLDESSQYHSNQANSNANNSNANKEDFAHQLCDSWEQMATSAIKDGVEVVLVRTGVVIHPSGGMLGRLIPAFKIGAGGQLGDGKQIMSWISREDWVRAVLFIINLHLPKPSDYRQISTEHNQLSIYNLTAPNPVNNASFTKAVGSWLNRPTLMTLPTPVLKMMFGEMSTLLIDGQKVLPKALTEAGFEFDYSELSQALQYQK